MKLFLIQINCNVVCPNRYFQIYSKEAWTINDQLTRKIEEQRVKIVKVKSDMKFSLHYKKKNLASIFTNFYNTKVFD